MQKLLSISIKILKWLAVAFLALVLVCNIYTLIQHKVYGNKFPTALGFGMAEVQSPSMEPTIMVGDVVVVCKKRSYDEQDVVAYRSDAANKQETPTTHRIIEIYEDGSYKTKGDNPANSADPKPVQNEQILGKVFMVLPGEVMSFLRSPAGLFLILLIGALIIFLPDVIAYFKKKPEQIAPKETKYDQENQQN